MTTQNKDQRAARLQQAIRLKKAAARSRAPQLAPRPADQAAHLSTMQHGLWLAHQLDPRSPAYNLTHACQVHGALDVAAVETAFNQVVARHRLLRSTFRAAGDNVLQIVHPHTPLAVEALTVADGDGLAAAVREASQPFDLETGPLIRLRLIAETTTDVRLILLVLHHILADERSLALLWQEMAAAYDGQLAETAPPLQYDDYVYGQGRDEAAHQQMLDFWRQRLEPLPEDLRLSFEKPTAEITERGAVRAPGQLLVRPLDSAVHQGIRRLAADTGATPFMVCAFAFRLLLQRYTGGQRFAFATPVSTRSQLATADMLGYFLNPVVLATLVDEAQSVAEAIRAFSRALKEALAHASLSFQQLAESLSPPRQRDRHPIFQAMFVYQEAPPPLAWGEARLEPVTLDLGASKFDLTVFVTVGARAEGARAEGARAEVAIEYRTDRFDEVWMRNLLGHYETLLAHLPADLERTTARVPILSAAEQSQVQAAAQGAELDTSAMALLPRQILDQAHRTPHAPAVVCGGIRRSYAELENMARTIAQALASHGVVAGDRVGLFIDRSPLMIAGLLASHWAGTAYVPLDPSYPAARNRHLLDDADVAAVLTTSTLRDRLPSGSWSVIDVDDLDPRDPQAQDGPQAAAWNQTLSDLSPASTAYILYTSGSTGNPKGVVITHDNLRASNAARLVAYDTSPKRFLLIPSVAFDSSVAGIFWTLATAGTLVIPTDDEVRDPRRLARLIADERVTSLLCVPSLYALLSADSDLLQGLEMAIVAGESCPSSLVAAHHRQLPHVRLFNEYGPTEATVWATVQELMPQDASPPVAIGRPIPGVRVEVVDGRGRALPAGIPGQLWIAGPTVAQGYWRRPDLTAERFVEADVPRYRTGDLASWTADGHLLFHGREDEQIKLRGFRIEPGEIEAALREVALAEEAAVVARANAELVAFIQTSTDDANASWRQELAKRLPQHMIPSRLVTLPALPRLPNGKTDRQRLRDMVLAEAEKTGAGPQATVPTAREQVPTTREQTLISLWEGLLGRSGITTHDNFFELGGHSLLVVEMIQAIQRDFEVTLSTADVFENPTVSTLAQRIAQQGAPDTPTYHHLFPLQPRGSGMPFIIAVPHFFSPMFASRFRGERPVYGLRGVSLRPEGNRGRWRTLTDLGEDLVDEIGRRFPDEKTIIAGYSFGASMAVETVRLMEARGIPVHRLYLIAPMPVNHYRFGPLQVQLNGLRKPVTALSATEALRLWAQNNHPLTSRPYRRAWRWLGIEPWRRFLCAVGRLRKLAGLPLTPRILHADVRVERFRLHARYRPQVLHTPTVIFNAQEAETDAAATWRPYFQGPFTVHPTPDPHLGDASAEAAREVMLHHLRDLDGWS